MINVAYQSVSRLTYTRKQVILYYWPKLVNPITHFNPILYQPYTQPRAVHRTPPHPHHLTIYPDNGVA